ncbi:MAG: phage protein GemA/Gp16 family protein, partial [Smithella sp.]
MKYKIYTKRQSAPQIPINGKQITVIKMAVRALGIYDGDYRDMLEDRYGVRSCTKLNYLQARAFIAELERKGFVLKPSKGIAR